MSLPPHSSQIETAAKRIRLLITDVDGVLTDGRLLFLPGGGETKAFNARDGLGINLLHAAGIRVAFISGRESEVVDRRAQELQVDIVAQGVGDKVEVFERILADLDCPEDCAAYIGDDLPDLPLIRRAGLGFAVADATSEVRSAARVVLRAGGGQGAVREACEMILRAKGAWKV